MTDSDVQIDRLPSSVELPKGLLYHYTTLDGLLGIVQHQSIWATHIRRLNDVSELKTAFSSECTSPLLNSLFPDADAESKERLRLFMAPPLGRYDNFVVSFTDDEAATGSQAPRPGDRLSQWRAYSSVSGGFSIGFDPHLVMKGWETCLVAKTGAECYLKRCRYSAAEKAAVAKSIGEGRSQIFATVLDQYLGLFRSENGRPCDPGEEESLRKRTIARIVGASCADYYLEAVAFKDDSYSEEHEWRIVFHAVRESLVEEQAKDPKSQLVRFRPGRFGITPYIEFPVRLTSTECPIRQIVAGPSPHKAESVDAVKLLLRAKGITIKEGDVSDGVEVRESEIPYRNW